MAIIEEDSNMNGRRLVWILMGVLVLILGVVFGIRLLRTSTITVEGPSGASIWAKQTKDYKRIGTNRASFKTQSLSTVFVEVRQGGEITQKSIQPKRRHNQRVSLRLKPLSEIQNYATGPSKYLMPNGKFIVGINPHTNSLSVKPKEGVDKDSLPILPILPFLNQLAWINPTDFVYVAADGTTGEVTGNQIILSGLPYTSAAAKSTGQIALAGWDGLFLATAANVNNPTKLVSATKNGFPNLLSDQNYIFYLTTVSSTPGGGDEDDGAKVTHSTGSRTQLTIFDWTGKKIATKDFSRVDNVVSLGPKQIALLSPGKLTLWDLGTNKTTTTAFDLGAPEDLLAAQGQLMLIGQNGLWEYDPEQAAFYRVVNYPPGEEYVPRSLTNISGTILFGSDIKKSELAKPNTRAKAEVYQLVLK